jgi:uncharacterized iron-regulated protein
MRRFCAILAVVAGPAAADPAVDAISQADADVVILGETHDNPHHHARQAEIVAALNPAALVFEFLTPAQAERHRPGVTEQDLKAALGWDEASGLPDFSMYYPIFAAAPEARILGARVPRPRARAAMQRGVVAEFSGDAGRFGLDVPLPAAEQAQRQAMQAEAHCDALPEEMLPQMVAVQRLRDAELARATLAALDSAGPPVVVITGNGHARKDRGVPAMLMRARTGVEIFALGQAEGGAAPAGNFDLVVSSPPVDRDDPCAAFR